MSPKRSFYSFVLVAVSVALSLPVFAFREPDPGPLRDKSFSRPDLYIGSAYLSEAELVARDQGARVSGLADLGVGPGGAYLDPRSGRWGTLMPSTLAPTQELPIRVWIA